MTRWLVFRLDSVVEALRLRCCGGAEKETERVSGGGTAGLRRTPSAKCSRPRNALRATLGLVILAHVYELRRKRSGWFIFLIQTLDTICRETKAPINAGELW